MIDRWTIKTPNTSFRQRAIVALSVLGLVALPGVALAGSARDYLNAPIDSWLTFYNLSYSTFVTPEDGIDVTSSIRSNVLSQSVVITRTMDYWGRTGGISVILPYRNMEASSDAFRASNQGPSEKAWLAKLARAFSDVADIDGIKRHHAALVKPQKDRVSVETWIAAEPIARDAFTRVVGNILAA
jgi:hypothetical protein